MWEHLVVSANPDWLDGCLCTQIQTGEGVVYQIRDERRGVPPGKRRKNEPAQEVVIDQGVSDKRLLIVEEEFSHTLKMAQRSGNTLSETIRLAWDSPRLLKTSNKNSPLKASDPHISLIGHTTRVELSNGMANRVLVIHPSGSRLRGGNIRLRNVAGIPTVPSVAIVIAADWPSKQTLG